MYMGWIKKGCITIGLVIVLFMLYDGSGSSVKAGMLTPSDFQNIKSDGKYMNDGYTYQLDMEKTGLFDKLFEVYNGLANIIFGLERGIAKLAIFVFYHCMNFNVSEQFADVIAIMQDKLHDSIFEPLLIVVLLMLGVKLINRLLRRNFTGAIADMTAVIFIMIVASLVVLKSSTILSNATLISKTVATNVLANMNASLGYDNGELEYATTAAGVLWENMVHKPWLELEFGSAKPERVEELMRTTDEDSREKIIEDLMKSNKQYEDSFAQERSLIQVSNCFTYLIPLLVKSVIYIAIAAIQLGFQLLAVFFVLLAPVVLVLSLFPGYDFKIIEVWLRKMLEYQVCIVVVTMMLSILIFLDNLLFEKARFWGWQVAGIFQIIIAVSLVMGRNQIFGMFKKIQRSVQAPGYAQAMLRNTGDVQRIGQSAEKNVRKIAKSQTVEKLRERLRGSYDAEYAKRQQGYRNTSYTDPENRTTLNKEIEKTREAEAVKDKNEMRKRERYNQAYAHMEKQKKRVIRPNTQNVQETIKQERLRNGMEVYREAGGDIRSPRVERAGTKGYQNGRMKIQELQTSDTIGHPALERTGTKGYQNGRMKIQELQTSDKIGHPELERTGTKAYQSGRMKIQELQTSDAIGHPVLESTGTKAYQNGRREIQEVQTNEKIENPTIVITEKVSLGQKSREEEKGKRDLVKKEKIEKREKTQKGEVKSSKGRARALSSAATINVPEGKKKEIKRPTSKKKTIRREAGNDEGSRGNETNVQGNIKQNRKDGNSK